MEKKISLPFYLKASIILIGLLATIFIFYIAQGIIVPIIFSVIISIILHPVVKFFVRLKTHRVLAIIITLTITFLLLSGLGIFLFSQASRFIEKLPELVTKFSEFINQAITWISGFLDVSPQKITFWISSRLENFIATGSAVIGKTIISVGSALVLLILIPVYIFLLLFYQPLIIEFIYRLSGKDNSEQVAQILNLIKVLIQDYLVGLLIQAGVIAVLYLTGLLILGIEYAILLAVSGAFLNMIPYIGAIIAAMLPMLMAVVTKPSPASALLVLGLYVLIQFIDNNILVPRIVASKVRLNALTSIIVVFSFGLLWGIPGMFLSIPLTAIIKVICDQIEPLKPLGFLLGDTMPNEEKS